MGELQIKPTNVVPLSVQLTDGNDTKSIRAFVRDNLGDIIFQRTLVNVENGFYHFTSYNMPSIPFITVQYIVYTDDTQTTIDTSYDIGNDVFYRDDSQSVVSSDVITANVYDNENLEANVYDNEKIEVKLKCEG